MIQPETSSLDAWSTHTVGLDTELLGTHIQYLAKGSSRDGVTHT